MVSNETETERSGLTRISFWTDEDREVGELADVARRGHDDRVRRAFLRVIARSDSMQVSDWIFVDSGRGCPGMGNNRRACRPLFPALPRWAEGLTSVLKPTQPLLTFPLTSFLTARLILPLQIAHLSDPSPLSGEMSRSMREEPP